MTMMTTIAMIGKMTEEKKTTSELAVTMVRKIVRDALWHRSYHEGELRQAHQRVAAATAMLTRGQYDEIDIQEIKENLDDFGIDDSADNAIDFVRSVVGDVYHSVDYHETELRKAHENIAAAKAVMVRGNYTEFTIAEIEIELQKAMQKAEEEEGLRR